MTITIPLWLLWALGIALCLLIVVPVLFFAFIGWSIRDILKNGIWR